MRWQEIFQEIAKDNIHGATYLTKRAIEALKSIASRQEFYEALERLPSLQPYMASLYNLAHYCKQYSDTFSPEFCDRWWEEFVQEQERIKYEALQYLKGKRVLTHSFSSLVFETLLEAQDIEVLCTESRPKDEGVTLAKKLSAKGIDTTLILDAAAPYLVQEVDIVLFGADGLCDEGVVHKVGSFAIALAAKYYRKEILVLCPKQKIFPVGLKLPPQSSKPSQEINECCKARNFYFDITPKDLLTTILT